MVTLTVTFVILAALLLWLCVDKKISKVLKGLMIAVVIWFGLALFYVPSNIMGWPVDIAYKDMPDMGVILSWKIIEPSVNPPEAGIYLWLVPKRYGEPEKSLYEIVLIDPRHAFTYTVKDTPRCYRLPYEKSEHEDLSKSARRARKAKGLLLFKKRPGGKWGKNKDGKDPDDKSKYNIIDPQKVFQKANE